MLDELSQQELCVLQSMLYEATENAYRIVKLGQQDRGWFSHYQALHAEVGQLFIDAALLLIDRLDDGHEVQAALTAGTLNDRAAQFPYRTLART